MEEIAAIMAKGFWPRLMGYISAAKNPNPERVLELIARGPTGIRTDYHIAQQILTIGQRARNAAKSWKANEPIWDALIPKLPGPKTPNIDGGPEGLFEFGMILRGQPDNAPRAWTDKPIVFSTDHLLSFQETIERLLVFAYGEGADTPGLAQVAQTAVEKWTTGDKGYILPQWIYERYIQD